MWVAQEGEGNGGERTNRKEKKERQAIKDQCTADNGPVEREGGQFGGTREGSESEHCSLETNRRSMRMDTTPERGDTVPSAVPPAPAPVTVLAGCFYSKHWPSFAGLGKSAHCSAVTQTRSAAIGFSGGRQTEANTTQTLYCFPADGGLAILLFFSASFLFWPLRLHL